MPDDLPCSISVWAFRNRFRTCSYVSVPLFKTFLHNTLLSKMIMDSIFLHSSCSTSCVTHRKTKHGWKFFREHWYQCSFTYSRRATDNNRFLNIAYHTLTPCNNLSAQNLLLVTGIMEIEKLTPIRPFNIGLLLLRVQCCQSQIAQNCSLFKSVLLSRYSSASANA